MPATERANSDEQREIIRERLAAALGTQSTADYDELHSRATGIEDAMSASLGPGSKEYMGKARSLVSNLKGNASLRQRVLSGGLHPNALVAASAKELASEALKVQRQQSAERFTSSRSLGSSSDRVVGWQAGTTGRIELPSEVDEVAEPSVAEPDDDTPAYRSLSAAPAAGASGDEGDGEDGPPPGPLYRSLGSAAASEAKRKAPPPAAPPPAAPPPAEGKREGKRRRQQEARAAAPRCSAGLCGAPAELEGGAAPRHPRLHVPLCLGHRSLFVERGKRGWPMDAEGLHDCCQWCCGEVMGDAQLAADRGADRGEVSGDPPRRQKREAVETLLCDGCDTAWCTPRPSPSPSCDTAWCTTLPRPLRTPALAPAPARALTPALTPAVTASPGAPTASATT